MANHRDAAALLMIVSLLVAVALSGADNARPTVRTNDAAGKLGTMESAKPGTELCSACEETEPKEEPELTCNKVHAVREGETCDSVGQCAGLGQDDFGRFNPNICCDHLFVGQWICLDATCAA